ncbi:MAG: matrixin family metalloprotease [Candidatus Obscuribacterales bacterium]|nr:matrixin family metalloprotease [Candidatus Obscuribacterales bacterium]
MPRRFSGFAFAMVAVAVIAPAAGVACGDSEDRSTSAPQASAFPPRNYAGHAAYGYGDGMMPRSHLEAMTAYPQARPNFGNFVPPQYINGSQPQGGRFRGLNSDFQSRMGRASISPRLTGQSAQDYLSQMVRDEGIGRWAPERFPLKVYFAPGRNVQGFRSSFKAQWIDAFNEWVAVSNGKLAWYEVNNPQDADIYCEWTAQVNQQRPNEAGFTVAMARNNNGTPVRTMGRAKITILTHYNGRTLTDRDMRKVCLHELGHAYGLQGHSPFSDDIMFSTTSRNQGESLSQRDVRSIQRLYEGYSTPSSIGAIGQAQSSVPQFGGGGNGFSF